MDKAQAVSIVIPVYNEEGHIKDCLDSIAAQTIKPFEVIVVDNNSTDASIDIARKYPFVKIITEQKQGVRHARTRGFDAAQGGLIGRIDADTVLPVNWLERIQKFYSHKSNQNKALTGGCYFYNIRLPYLWGWFQGQIAFRMNRLLLGYYITYGSNMVITKHAWEQIKHATCQRDDIHEDLDIAIHLHEAHYKITYKQNLKVGVKMKRVRSNHHALWGNLMLWPNTLKAHNKKTWVFGWIGALIIYCAWPLGPIMEWIAVHTGKPPLSE